MLEQRSLDRQRPLRNMVGQRGSLESEPKNQQTPERERERERENGVSS
jgi:hypothetical protein